MRKVFLFVLIPKKRPSPVAATESKVRVCRLLWIMCQARCTTVYLIVLPHGFLYHTFLYRRSSHLANLPGTYSSAVTAELSIGDKKKNVKIYFWGSGKLKRFSYTLYATSLLPNVYIQTVFLCYPEWRKAKKQYH